MNRDTVNKFVLILLVIFISAIILSMIRAFLMAIFTAGIFSALASPLYRRLERLFRGRRSLASLTTLLFIVIVILLPLSVLMGIITAQAIEVGHTVRPWVQEQISKPGAFSKTLSSIIKNSLAHLGGKMNTVRLGGTDLEISEVGFGGIPIIPLPENEAVSIVKYCFDLGITFFDTANMYRSSEKKIGTALKAVRDRVVIATKTTQRAAKEAAEHIDFSLKQLKTDWIDIYQLHNLSNRDALQQVLAPQGAYEAAYRAREAGKIRFIGISSHSIPTAMDALKTGLFQTLQFPFNFIENDPADELFPFAHQKDVGIIGMKPLGGGLLERADLCFGFLQQHPYVVPIPGIREKREADEILDLYRNRKLLSKTDLNDMQDIRAALGEKFCHRCEYCMPCEQGVQISSVLIFQAAAKRISREGVVAWLGNAMDSVEECIECGECEEKCPYGLPITDLLKENLTLYKEYI